MAYLPKLNPEVGGGLGGLPQREEGGAAGAIASYSDSFASYIPGLSQGIITDTGFVCLSSVSYGIYEVSMYNKQGELTNNYTIPKPDILSYIKATVDELGGSTLTTMHDTTNYYFNVISCDSSGNIEYSKEFQYSSTYGYPVYVRRINGISYLLFYESGADVHSLLRIDETGSITHTKAYSSFTPTSTKLFISHGKLYFEYRGSYYSKGHILEINLDNLECTRAFNKSVVNNRNTYDGQLVEESNTGKVVFTSDSSSNVQENLFVTGTGCYENSIYTGGALRGVGVCQHPTASGVIVGYMRKTLPGRLGLRLIPDLTLATMTTDVIFIDIQANIGQTIHHLTVDVDGWVSLVTNSGIFKFQVDLVTGEVQGALRSYISSDTDSVTESVNIYSMTASSITAPTAIGDFSQYTHSDSSFGDGTAISSAGFIIDGQRLYSQIQ